MTNTTTVDFAAPKAAQRAGWDAGDYPRVGNTLQIMAELLVHAAGVRAGESVLDVACGQGNAALAAARRFAEATGVDYAPRLLEQGRRRAEVEGLPVTFVDGDAEALPVEAESVDVALSTVGVMFAPDQPRAAGELVRVTRPGGRIALASWTPAGMVGRMLKLVASVAPPPPGIVAATAWGTSERLEELFGDTVDWVSLEQREFVFSYLSPEHFAQWFIQHYGPIARMSAKLSDDDQKRFAYELAAVASRFDPSENATISATAGYLEAVGIRR
jgi:ubiquinone/menaquinone biosynthesis C-methylase UbiE